LHALRVEAEKPLAEQDPIKTWILSTLPHALAYAASLVRNQDQAEDVVHDCYCRLLQRATVYDLPRDGQKILLRAITNAAIDLQGRQRVLRSLDVGNGGDCPESGEVMDRRTEGPMAGAMMRELEQALEAGLEQLPLAQRAALQMKSMGHSLQEIADTLAISASHAGVLVHRARQSLARSLAPFLEDTAR
jgi:RNA polymerase sigma-70 factor (ECF subfamily)